MSIRKEEIIMKFSPIITVGRQYGSGGREVAKKLAEVMNFAFYDKELLAEASKESGICQEVMENYDEKQEKRSFFSMMGLQGRMDPAGMYLEMPLNHRIFLAQFDAIRKIADKGPCVIVGRCADYVLRDHETVLNVFIKASMPERIKRITKLYGLDPMKAEEAIRKADKQRATYYNYYATGTWGDVANYHLCLDTGVLGIEGTVELIRRAIELREDKAEEDGIQW
jgi:cytidylate kinase